MTHYVTIKPSGLLLVVEDDETVLDAALRSGFEFPYSCGSATCGTCMGKVLSGEIDYGNIEPYALDDTAKEEGYALFCSARPLTDLTIEVEDVYAPYYAPVAKLEVDVAAFNILNHDLYQVFLSPKKKALSYQAGQYLKITCDDGTHLPFSIANAPQEDGAIELHIKAVPSNRHTTEILNKVSNNNMLNIRGAYGNTVYHEDIKLPTLFIAGGTGIVPIKALIERALQHNDGRTLTLYWGAKNPEDLYLAADFAALTERHSHFHFIQVTEKFVHEAVATAHPNMTGFQVYASGPTDMVYTALETFTALGLKPQLMFSDTFEIFPRG